MRAFLISLLLSSAAFAVGNRPDAPLELDTSAMHYADLRFCIPFSEGTGATAADLVGSYDLTANGSVTTNYTWTSALNGYALQRVPDSGEYFVFPAASGNQVMTKGTILIVARALDSAETSLYSTGRGFATTAGEGQFGVHITGGTSVVVFRHKDSSSDYTSADTIAVAVDTWFPMVIVWDASTDRLDVSFIDSGGTQRTISRTGSMTDAQGFIIRDTLNELLMSEGAGDAPNGDVAFAAAWTEPFSTEEVASALSDPWFPVQTHVDHKFLIRNQTLVGRQLPTQVSLFKTAQPGANVSWRVRYGADSGWNTNGVLSEVSTSSQSATEERLEIQLSGLASNTQYHYGVEINTNGAGWTEVSTNGTFWTATSDNTDTVRGMVMSDCHVWQNQDEDATTKPIDIQGVVDVAKFWDVQATIHLGDITSVAKDGFDDRASVGEFYQYFFSKWANLINTSGLYVVMGNHDLGGCEYYGVSDAVNSTSGSWQLWGTQFWKSCFGNPQETWTAPFSEWMRDADAADPSGAWVASPNRQPFETCGRFRHGPVEFFFVDSERFGDPDIDTNGSGESCSSAEHATLGATQIAQLKSAILTSNATFKVVCMHRPTGGYDVDGAGEVAEAYRRGSPAVIGKLRTSYEWASLWSWFEAHGVQAVLTGHDHLASIVRLDRSPQLVSIVAGSPLLPFSFNYDNGYNASSSDPHLGPYTNGTSLSGVDALFYSNDRGVWIYEASGSGTSTKVDDQLTFKWVRTVNDSRNATLNEVGFTYVIKPMASSGGGTRSMGIGL